MLFRIALTFLIAIFVIGLHYFVRIDSNQVQKLLLFMTACLFLATRRIRWEIIVLIALMLLVTLITAGLSSYNGFSFGRYIRSAFSLGVTFLMLAGEPTERDRDTLIRLLTAMPIAMVVLGGLYDAAGIHPLLYTDFTGAVRLQGTGIPAGLGTVGYLGVTAAILGAAIHRSPVYLWLSLINLVILALSAARMPLALATCLFFFIYYTSVNRGILTRVASLCLVIPAGLIFLVVFGGGLIRRFQSESLSGRDLIWAALQQVLDKYPVFGIGLGHQISVIPPAIAEKAATVAAHNEYLRLSLELGYPGAVVVFGLMCLMVLAVWYRSKPKTLTFLLVCASFFAYCKTDNAISSTTTPLIVVLASFAFSCRPAPVRRRVYAVPIRPPVVSVAN